MSGEPSGFSKYLVIFVDILGSQNRVDFQETYKINKIFHEEFEKLQERERKNTKSSRYIYTFSDCAYIFYGLNKEKINGDEDLGEFFKVALCNCEPIFLRFLNERIIFRGGISYGDAYIDHDRSMFFGPAINWAYKIESEVAIYPRIVIEEEVANSVIGNITQVEYKMTPRNLDDIRLLGADLIRIIPETGHGIVEQDFDGKFIYNYLHTPESGTAFPAYYCCGNTFIREIMDYSQDQIKKHYENKQYKIVDKYLYLNKFCQSKLKDSQKQQEYEEKQQEYEEKQQEYEAKLIMDVYKNSSKTLGELLSFLDV